MNNAGSPFRAAKKHRCPVPECPNLIGSTSFMCRTHWHLVPSAMKVAVLKAWNDDAQSAAFGAAMDAAALAVSKAVARTGVKP